MMLGLCVYAHPSSVVKLGKDLVCIMLTCLICLTCNNYGCTPGSTPLQIHGEKVFMN